MEKLFPVLHEDERLLVINKPAGLACHPTKGDEYSSLVSRVRLHLGEGAKAHLINRLDRETSGVVMVAKTDEAARQLRRIWERREVRKEYHAIAHGHLPQDQLLLDWPTGKDEKAVVTIRDCVREDGSPAQTEVSVLCRFARAEGAFSWLRVFPRTGRKHQIRIHLAHLGHPVVGDKMYGGNEMVYLDFVYRRLTEEQRRQLIFEHHALHAFSLTLKWDGVEVCFKAEPEAWFKDFLPHGAWEARSTS